MTLLYLRLSCFFHRGSTDTTDAPNLPLSLPSILHLIHPLLLIFVPPLLISHLPNIQTSSLNAQTKPPTSKVHCQHFCPKTGGQNSELEDQAEISTRNVTTRLDTDLPLLCMAPHRAQGKEVLNKVLGFGLSSKILFDF